MASMSAMSLTLDIGLAVAFFASAWMQQATFDKWTRDTGRAPMIQKKGAWNAYMWIAKHEMPASISKRISLFGWIGRIALILFLVLDWIGATVHRH